MAEVNTVCISVEKFESLIEEKMLYMQQEAQHHNFSLYNERLENAIIEYIAKETGYGEYDWKLRGEFADLISIMDLHEYDWSKHKPAETEEE